MKVAFLLFDGLTALDLIGCYDPVTRLRSMDILPELSWDFCALKRQVCDDKGLAFPARRVGEPLGGYDVVIAPGGFGTRAKVQEPAFIDWVRTAAPVPLKASVCTGALLYGAAGFLEGLRATTHPGAYEELRPYCREVTDERVVDEGAVVTARGVTSAIDLGLHLVGRLAGPEARERIRTQMDYPYGA